MQNLYCLQFCSDLARDRPEVDSVLDAGRDIFFDVWTITMYQFDVGGPRCAGYQRTRHHRALMCT